MSLMPQRRVSPSFWGAVWAGVAAPAAPWARTDPPLTLPRPRDVAAEFRPDLVCNVAFYPTAQGGRRSAIRGDLHRWFACPCKVSPEDAAVWDVRLLLEGEIINPGDRRRLGVRFLSRIDALDAFAPVERFYLWEGRVIGEADVLQRY